MKDMTESEFRNAILEKNGTVEDADGYRMDLEGATGSVEKHITYSPMDECPHCSKYKYVYKAMRTDSTSSKPKVIRVAACLNCKYVEKVGKDPIKDIPSYLNF